MRIVIASCKELPSFEKDDRPFHAVLAEYGIDFIILPWDEIEDASKFDACLIRTTWDYVERWQEFSAWTQKVSMQTRLIHDADLIAWNIDKRYLYRLNQHGVAIAPTLWLEQSIDLRKWLEENDCERGFLKPIVGACASDTKRFSMDNVDEAQDFLDRCCAQQQMMLQPYVHTVETEGEYSTIFFGGRFSHAVRKIPVPGDYRVQDDFGAADEGIEAPDGLMQLSQQTLQHIPFPWLYARVDALHTPQGDWVLNELEMIEPSLFFRHAAHAPKMLCEALIEVLSPSTAKD